MKDKQNIIIMILVVIVMFGGGYAIGTATKKEPEKILTSTTKTSITSTTKESTESTSFKDVEETPNATTETKPVEKEDKPKKQERRLPEELLPYTDDQIEYARI